MVVEPKVRGFICVTAHPEGCKESVRRQIEYAKSQERKESPKKPKKEPVWKTWMDDLFQSMNDNNV